MVNEKGLPKGCAARWFRYSLICVGLTFFSARATDAAVNVYLPPSLQTTLLSDLTNQWNGTLTVSKFDPTVYSFTVTSRKPVPPPPTTTPPLVDISSNPYIFGWVMGQDFERANNLGIINGFYVACSTMSTCQVALSSAAVAIHEQDYQPTLVPLP